MKVPACLPDVLALISTQGDECTVIPMEDGWHITLKSADNVSMCDALVKAEAFEGYSAGEAFCFTIAPVARALARTAPSEIAVGDAVTVSGCDLKVRLPRLAVMDPPKVPQLAQDAQAIVPVKALTALTAERMPNDAELRIRVSAEGLTAEVADDRGYGTSLEIPADRLTVLDGSASANYPLTHVGPILRALPKDSQVCLELSDDYPLTMSCVQDGWTAEMLVAPRINVE